MLQGTIVCVSRDNLGSHSVGGFKGSSTGLHPCRHCMVTYNEMKELGKINCIIHNHNVQ